MSKENPKNALGVDDHSGAAWEHAPLGLIKMTSNARRQREPTQTSRLVLVRDQLSFLKHEDRSNAEGVTHQWAKDSLDLESHR